MDLRIGDAERDAVTEALHEHFAKGRLTRDELDERLTTTLAAKTESDLRKIVEDLPDPSGLPQPYQHPHQMAWRHHHHPMHRHGPPRLVPFLLAFFLIAAITGGPAAGLFFIGQALLVFWLAAGLFAFVRLRRIHRMHH